LPYLVGELAVFHATVGDIYPGENPVKVVPPYVDEFIVIELPQYNISFVTGVVFIFSQATLNDILYVPEVEGIPVYVTLLVPVVGIPIISIGTKDEARVTVATVPSTYTEPLYQLKGFDGPLLIRYCPVAPKLDVEVPIALIPVISCTLALLPTVRVCAKFWLLPGPVGPVTVL
jgi:hypothetical protein